MYIDNVEDTRELVAQLPPWALIAAFMTTVQQTSWRTGQPDCRYLPEISDGAAMNPMVGKLGPTWWYRALHST